MQSLLWALIFLVMEMQTIYGATIVDFYNTYEKGKEAVQQQDWQRAQHLLEALPNDKLPDRALNHKGEMKTYFPQYYLGKAYLNQGRPTAALKQFKALVDRGFSESTDPELVGLDQLMVQTRQAALLQPTTTAQKALVNEQSTNKIEAPQSPEFFVKWFWPLVGVLSFMIVCLAVAIAVHMREGTVGNPAAESFQSPAVEMREQNVEKAQTWTFKTKMPPLPVFSAEFVTEKLYKTGGQANIYLLKSRKTGELLAAKTPHLDEAITFNVHENFVTEAKMAQRLIHKNIVSVYGWGLTENAQIPYILMEYFPSLNLREVLIKHQTLQLSTVVEIGLEIAYALDYAHSFLPPVVHKDLKPENILIQIQGGAVQALKVVDYGISFQAHTGKVGTPPYVSPEQAKMILEGANGAQLPIQSDYYCLGLILYELLTGSMPFYVRGSVRETCINVMSKKLPLHQKYKPMFPVFARLMQPNPANRFRTGEEIIQGLREVKFALLQGQI